MEAIRFIVDTLLWLLMLAFLLRQHRRGLIQDKDFRVSIEHFENFNALTLADRKIANGSRKVDR